MHRGDVYRLRPLRGVGHEQRGERYGVVLQSDEHLPRSVVIVAMTSRRAQPSTFRPEVQIAGETTCVMVEQLSAVDASRLGDLAGHLSPDEQWGVDDALTSVLGL